MSIKWKGWYHQVITSDYIIKVAQTFGTRVLTIIIGLLTSVMVSRALGPEGKGLYAVAVSIGAVGVQFGNLGLHASNTYFIAQERGRLPVLLGNSLLVGFGFGGLIALACWIIFLLRPEWAPISGLLLILALLWIPLGLLYLLFQNLLIGIQEIFVYNQIELFTKIGAVALIGCAIFFNQVNVQVLFSIGIISVSVASIWSLIKLCSHLAQAPIPSLKLLKNGFLYGFKAYLAALFSFLVLKVDLLLVAYLLGRVQAGYYSIAVGLADMVYLLPMVSGTILFPKLSAMSSNKEKWKYSRRVAWIMTAFMVSVASFSGLFSRIFIRLLFGDVFIPAVAAFNWLLPAIVFLSINTVFMNYFASIGMPSITVYSPGLAMVTNVLLNLILIPKLGIIGASMSSIVAYGMMLIMSIIYLRKGVDYGIGIS
jgi:O-antigen/teichoic acid export membrane protein